jgi:hypothetical protein
LSSWDIGGGLPEPKALTGLSQEIQDMPLLAAQGNNHGQETSRATAPREK